MKRWNHNFEKRTNRAVDAFLADILEVCKKHDMSISHEDNEGAFEIERMSTYNMEWLLNANDATDQ
jgi:hypothetical protein